MNGDSPIKIPSGLNFNSFLVTIALGVILWTGNKTAENSDSLVQIKTQLPYVNASVLKLESQLALLVTRAELDGRLADVAAKLVILDKRLMTLEFEKKKPEQP